MIISKTLNLSEKKIGFVLCIILAAITIAVYWQVQGFDFINYDDPAYITENSHIQSGLTQEGFSGPSAQNISVCGILWSGSPSWPIMNFTVSMPEDIMSRI